MANMEWYVPHQLITPKYETVSDVGALDLNVASGWRYLIQPDGYSMVPSLRVTQDNISQMDGSVMHPRYTSGMVAAMRIAYYTTVDLASFRSGALDTTDPDSADSVACGDDLRIMHQRLSGHLNALRGLVRPQRLLWEPSGMPSSQPGHSPLPWRRMLEDIQLLTWPQPQWDGLEASVSFSVESPYPYAVNEFETLVTIDDGETQLVTNSGNADFFPIVRVHGEAHYVRVVREIDDDGTPGQQMVYDDTRPGAGEIIDGHYADFNFFKGTVFDSDDTDGAHDLIVGVDPLLSDFFSLPPGDSNITAHGARVTIHMNSAWI